MVGLKDLLAVLDKWPVWKRVKEAPDRIDNLENRVEALEKRLEKVPGDACPACGSLAMRLTEQGRRMGGGLTSYRHDVWTCEECSYEEEKLHTFAKK